MSLRTLSEIASTGARAARGAGCPWDLAEEAGAAVRRLSAQGLPGPEALAALLGAPRACPCTGRAAGPVCGLSAMCRAADRIGTLPQRLPEVAQPLLVVGAVALAARARGVWVRVTWPGAEVICGPGGLGIAAAAGLTAPVAGPVLLADAVGASAARPPSPAARPVDPEAWSALETLAARTLVPETEASRARGAGPAT